MDKINSRMDKANQRISAMGQLKNKGREYERG